MTATVEIYANNASSVVATGISAVATTLYISSGDADAFPTPVVGKEFFRLRITSASAPNSIEEIVFVTERVDNQLTIVRGQEGTTPQAWSVNDPCWNAATAGTYFQFMQPYYGVNSTGANFYTVQTNTYADAYYDGMLVMFLPLLGNTIVNPTLNVNGLGAIPIRNSDGSTILAGQIPGYTICECVYNSDGPRWELLSLNGVGVTPVLTDNSTKYATTEFVKNALAGAGQIPSGVKMLFLEASAPVGWTQVTTFNNYALRLVNATGGGTGGTVNFSTAFSNQSISGTIGGTSLTVDQLPSHSHTGSTGSENQSHKHNQVTPSTILNYQPGSAALQIGFTSPTTFSTFIQSDVQTASHNHNFTTASTGAGNTHTHSLSGANVNLAVKYVDIIACEKD